MDLIEAELVAMPRRPPSAHSVGSAASAGVSMSALRVAVAPGQLMVRPEAIQAFARVAAREEDVIRSLENPSPQLAALVSSRERRQASVAAQERVAAVIARDDQAMAAAGMQPAPERDEDDWAPGQEDREEEGEDDEDDDDEDDDDDEEEYADMEDDRGDEAAPGEQLAHAEASGYLDAVPAARPEFEAAAAAAGAAGAAAGAAGGARRGGRRAAPGVPMTIEDVAKAMTADDIKPEDGLAWGVFGQEFQAAIDAIVKLGSSARKDALGNIKLNVSADRVKAFAMKGTKERTVTLTDSVSEAGVDEKVHSADLIASDIANDLNRIVKLMFKTEGKFYKLANANHVVRHFRLKFVAQRKQRNEDAAARATQQLKITQIRMLANGQYQERQINQAKKRKKSSTAEAAKPDRFADLS